jgi:hypothetical protein
MPTLLQPTKGAEKILCALGEFDYLTAEQITRLCYAPSSVSFVKKKLRLLVAAKFVLALPRQSVTAPTVYTLTGKGRAVAETLALSHA